MTQRLSESLKLSSSNVDTVIKSGRRPRLKLRDRLTNRFSEKTQSSPFILKDPKDIYTEFKLDSVGKISVYEQTKGLSGDNNYRPAERMTLQQFNQLQEERFMRDYWKKFSSSQDGKDDTKGRGLLPKIELPPAIDRIFGGAQIDLKPVGNIIVDVGYISTFYDNPATPVALRRITQLNFTNQMQVSLQGKIGDKMNINTNFDTKASFNFQNQLKLNWRTNEEDILQNIELGNTSWQLNSQLIPGVQNLFGVKTLFRLGNLDITAVAAQQRSKQDCITLKGGSQNKSFEIKGSAYDENKHFFLSQYFRDNYEKSLRNLPVITSGMTINRIEVYVTNRTQNTETLRNIAAFSDLGEGDMFKKNIPGVTSRNNKNLPVDNQNNTLFRELRDSLKYPILRKVNETVNTLEINLRLNRGRDYDMLRGAKRLTEREFTFNTQLGYISLITPLRNDEVLAVSYEYTKDGRRYQVGELTEDYQSLENDKVLFLKMLKSSTIRNNLDHPMWNLMMKNVYSLNAQQLTKQGFQFRVIYKDDQTGVDNPNLQEGAKLKDIPLIRVLGLDKLNQNGDPQIDGNFDYVEGVTIDSRNGKIIFPVLEPFGSALRSQFNDNESDLINAYVFDKLYSTTQTDAIQITSKDKFFLKGSFQAGVGGDVSLPFGVDAKSVQVTAGGVALSAGTDYIVEPQSGRVRILNSGLSNSGREIRICYEKPDLFNNQIRTLVGTHIDYTLGQNLHLGGTIQHMNESPPGFLRRVQIGNEPVSNTIFGFDASIQQKSNFLTRMIDALPLISTKETSAFDFQGEYAKLIPAVNQDVQNNAFIDDFEGVRNIFSLNNQPTAWKPSATPPKFIREGRKGEITQNNYRAKISAYTSDFSLFSGAGGNLDATGIDAQEASRFAYERQVQIQSLFPNRALANNITGLPLSVLDISYFPSERGIYNFTTRLDRNGDLLNPTQNYGAITRALTSDTDFDNANIETLEFWMMNPLLASSAGGTVRATGTPQDIENSNIRASTGGKLIFQLGDISEDFVPDNYSNFENGIPAGEKLLTGNQQNIERTVWGLAPRQQFVTNTFTTGDNGTRSVQDVGLDGLPDKADDGFDETSFFSTYLTEIGRVVSATALNEIRTDPAGDNFYHYLSDKYNATQTSSLILRYKNYSGIENNSPSTNSATANTSTGFTESNSQQPDREDLNQDNTINETEAFYEYEIDVKPEKMVVGQNYIVDEVTEAGVKWYLFRIPIKKPTATYGGINGFKNIRFIRTVLSEWQQPVVCRFASFQLSGFQYRKYTGDFTPRGLQGVIEPNDSKFKVSVVNIEENGKPDNSTAPIDPNSVSYVVPPGFERDRDITTVNNAELNEQSLSLCVEDLKDGDAKAAFKNTLLDLINYRNLRMFVSMNSPNRNVEGKVNAFLRLGTDLDQNYYEVETQPLKQTSYGKPSADQVWVSENEIDIPLDVLKSVKLSRDRKRFSLTERYTELITTGGRTYQITVVGRPDLSTVLNTMIGVRNPLKGIFKDDDGEPKTFCVWVNELRASGFDQSSGEAAIGKLSLKLADFANITINGSFRNFGFGGVQSKISERARETTIDYGIAANINVDKLLPEKWGLKIPLYVTYDRKNIIPQFNPLDPDIPLDSSVANLNPDQQSDYRKSVEDNTERKGINLTNVRKVKTGKDAKLRSWDVENLTFTYAYSELVRTNTLIDEYRQTQYKGGLTYSFTGFPKAIEPFKKIKSNHPILKWVKEFNFTPLPNSVTLRADMDRSFIKTQLRNADVQQGTAAVGTPTLTSKGVVPMYEKYWLFNRAYNVNWNLTKSVVVGYNSLANAIIDEPYGGLESQSDRDSVARNLRRFGRTKGFDQNVNAIWRLPLNKSPLTDWMTADYSHKFGYTYFANSYEIKDDDGFLFGNMIKNTRVRGINGKVDFVALYNRIRALRIANQPRISRKNVARNPGDDEDIIKPQPNILRSITRLLMTLRGIQVNYNIDESTTLPGFLPTPGLLGNGTGDAPGFGFITGSQDADIRFRAANNGWITKSRIQNVLFLQTRTQNLTYRTALEPFRDFKIQVEGKWSKTDNYSENFRGDSLGRFVSQNPLRSGNYSMSFLSFLTAFDSNSPDENSVIFNRFKGYRGIILDRLNQQKKEQGIGEGKYNLNSQDVLVPAFFAAYSGTSPDKVSFSPFLNLPMPNWRVDYNGLTNISWFKKRFSNISIQHSYSSTYSVGEFKSELGYGYFDPTNPITNVDLSLNNTAYTTATRTKYDIYRQDDRTYASQKGDEFFAPVYSMSVMSFQEKFSPLIGVNATLKGNGDSKSASTTTEGANRSDMPPITKNVTLTVSYSQDRNLVLNLGSLMVTDVSNRDFNFSLGFTRANMLIPFKVGGRRVRMKNDFVFKTTFGIRDSRYVNRFIDAQTTVTQGATQFQLNPMATYKVSDQLSVTAYYSREYTNPFVSSQFYQSTDRAGFRVVFDLARSGN
ncbi:MAG: cell surface protein SprA [Arcicella sp.]|nr:cell surface protein SprA [Arcicella sp.]